MAMSEARGSAVRLPTLPQLRTFLAVVETGTLSLAAKRLHLTQPAVSQQLQELERILGVRLLERLPGGVVATAAGEDILAPLRRTLQAAEDIVTAATEHSDGGKGRLRIGTGGAVSAFLLPEVLSKLKEAMPLLDVRVGTGSTPDLLRRVDEGELDVAIVTLPITPRRTLEIVPLVREPMLALIPAEIDDGSGAPVTPEILAALPLILDVTGAHTRLVTDCWFADAGLSPTPMMEVAGTETVRCMVRRGLGATILPRLAVGNHESRPLDPPLWRELAVATRADKRRDKSMRAFLAELERTAALLEGASAPVFGPTEASV